MIPKEITPEHLAGGIDKINKESYPSRNDSEDYDVFYHGKYYPPKMVISYAASFVHDDGVNLSVRSFSSGIESFSFLAERGFPIVWKEHKNPDGCITQDDCWFFDAISDKPYDSSNPIHENQGDYLNHAIWMKTKRWADMVSEETSFLRKGQMRWLERRNSTTAKQRFRYYTWYQLHHTEYYDENVFYTVGFEGPHLGHNKPTQLVIKLDCKRGALAAEQQQAFDRMLHAHGVDWHYIGIPAKERFISWEELINESAEFISKTFQVYLQAISIVNSLLPEMAARITWNYYGWIRPSGREGKSRSSADSHERLYGYCPEEWLFDIDKTIDGYHYGRIEPLHTESDKHVGKILNVTLFSNHYDSKTWYWVGRIMRAEVINDELSSAITQEYQERGWLNEQLAQLGALPNVDVENWQLWEPGDRFNIRFRHNNYILYDLEPFAFNETPPSGHYNLPTLKSLPAFLTQEGASMFDNSGLVEGNGNGDDKNPEIIRRIYTGGVRELEDVHKKVQRGYANYLRQSNPGSIITVETGKKINRTRIDIVEKRPDGSFIFYEVKTYPNVMTSIRIAIGQLLEYAFYPQQILTKNLVIVSHLPAGPKELAFLSHLSKIISIDLSYVAYNIETGLIG